MSDAKPEIDGTQALEILRKEEQTRIDKCNREILRVLNKYGCTLDVSMIVTQRGCQPRVQIVPKPQS